MSRPLHITLGILMSALVSLIGIVLLALFGTPAFVFYCIGLFCQVLVLILIETVPNKEDSR